MLMLLCFIRIMLFAVVARAPDMTLQFVMDGNQLVFKEPGPFAQKIGNARYVAVGIPHFHGYLYYETSNALCGIVEVR